MITSVCRELKNYFEYHKEFGTFEIVDGALAVPDNLDIKEGQYFRIAGSVFNDGVYQFPATKLHDETFDGVIWLMAVPVDFLALISDIDEWQKKNGGADSAAMSPFQSESFGGYSYSKGSTASGGNAGTWQNVFASRLNAFRKI